MRPSFNIKVAILGHVSVGKSTVLNALFADKLTEVSMRRTTAGINSFHIWSSEENSERKDEVENGVRPSQEILKEISEDNQTLRKKSMIQEKSFDVVLKEHLVTMRDDTRLTFIDVPGLNEAGTRQMYREFVEKSWQTFDCVIVVMDAMMGVNTEEQVSLLKFIKENLEKSKKVPVIVLCNKVDDVEDRELKTLVAEVEEEANRTLEGHESVFLPISAGKAFLYRAASRLSLSEFKRLDTTFIDKIGYEEYGRFRWMALSADERCKIVHDVVNNKDQYKTRMRACNFDAFLGTLQRYLGGVETQAKLLHMQLDFKMQKLSYTSNFAQELVEIHTLSCQIGAQLPSLDSQFWRLYYQAKDKAFVKFEVAYTNFKYLHELMDELVKYHIDLRPYLLDLHSGEAQSEEEDTISEMIRLIRQLFSIVCQKQNQWNFVTYLALIDPTAELMFSVGSWEWNGNSWHNSRLDLSARCPSTEHPALWRWKNDAWRHSQSSRLMPGTKNEHPIMEFIENIPSGPHAWERLSPLDWSNIATSIMMMSHRRPIAENFGKQLGQLQWMVHRTNSSLQNTNAASPRSQDALKEKQENNNHSAPAFSFGAPRPPASPPVNGFGGQENVHQPSGSNGFYFGVPSNATKQKQDKKDMFREFHSWLKGTYDNGEFLPTNVEKYKLAMKVEIPASPKEEAHWGHVLWKFSNFVETETNL